MNLSKVDGFLNLSKVDRFLNLSKVDGFLNLSKVEVLFPERRRHLLILSIGILEGALSILFFEVNDVLCRFDYNYESVCDADLQLNQFIVSVAPELLSHKRF